MRLERDYDHPTPHGGRCRTLDDGSTPRRPWSATPRPVGYHSGVHDHTPRKAARPADDEPEQSRAAALERILAEISLMRPEDLRAVRTAVEGRAGQLGASTIAERRGFRDGILQLEYRLGKAGAMRGPYWYFRYRRSGAQKVLYLGRTDDPEALAAAKLDDPASDRPAPSS